MKKPGKFLNRVLMVLPIVMLLAACDKVRNAARNLEKKAGDAAGSAASTQVIQLSGDSFESFTAQQGKVVIIDFYADWCGPCRKLAPILDRVAAESGGLVVIGKVNVDQQRELAGQHKVHSIPDVRIFRNGKQVDRFVGAPGETQVRERIEGHTRGLSSAGPAAEGQSPAENPQPAITPATKDWLPQGIERR
jgi:thioredoxin 1